VAESVRGRRRALAQARAPGPDDSKYSLNRAFCHGATRRGTCAAGTRRRCSLTSTVCCVTYDHRGSGESPVDPALISVEAMVEDVGSVLDALRIERCIHRRANPHGNPRLTYERGAGSVHTVSPRSALDSRSAPRRGRTRSPSADSEDAPRLGDALQFVLAAVFELKPGPRDQILDRARGKHLAGSGQRRDA
jgi:hypothetical protein